MSDIKYKISKIHLKKGYSLYFQRTLNHSLIDQDQLVDCLSTNACLIETWETWFLIKLIKSTNELVINPYFLNYIRAHKSQLQVD